MLSVRHTHTQGAGNAMHVTRRTTEHGFDLLVLFKHGLAPVMPDGWQGRTHERRTASGQVLVDGRPMRNDPAGKHETCKCRDCVAGLAAYESDTDAVLDGMRITRDRLLHTARHCSDSALGDWYRIMRAGWSFYEEHGKMDLRKAVFLQCEYLACAYEQACMIVFKRMARIARERVNSDNASAREMVTQ